MTLSKEERISNCKAILSDPNINNKIVILCEGEVRDLLGSRSPSAYKEQYSRIEQYPDANFYKSCIPSWFHGLQPKFFNCGNNFDVIQTYFTLKNSYSDLYREIYNRDIQNPYLNPEKLFAIVDLDIQKLNIKKQKSNYEDYSFTDTVEIYNDLYQNFQVNEANASNHRIWVTGFIQKEAYFLIPELQSLFNEDLHKPTYKDNLLVLQDIYADMADDLDRDLDIKENLDIVRDRLACCTGLDCSSVESLKISWKDKFSRAKDPHRKEELIWALLTIKKAKDKNKGKDKTNIKGYWEKIKFSRTEDDLDAELLGYDPDKNFRKDLSLKIGKDFYRRQEKDSKHHIPIFFKTLYNSTITI